MFPFKQKGLKVIEIEHNACIRQNNKLVYIQQVQGFYNYDALSFEQC